MESKQKAVGAVEEFLDLQLEDARDEVRDALSALVNSGIHKDDVKNGGKKFASSLHGVQAELYEQYLLAQAYHVRYEAQGHEIHRFSDAGSKTHAGNEAIRTSDSDGFLLNLPPDGTYDLRKGMDGKQAPCGVIFYHEIHSFLPRR